MNRDVDEEWSFIVIDQSIFYPKVSLASSDSLCKLHKMFDLTSNLYNAKYDKIQIALRWPSDMCEILPGRIEDQNWKYHEK